MKENKSKLNCEESAFIEELVLRNDTLIRNVLMGVLAENFRHLTDECIAETYLLACRRADVLKDHPNPDGWVVKTAKTKALELLNKHKNEKLLPLEEALSVSAHQNVEEEAQYNIWQERFYISEVLSSLSKREKQIYKLLYIDRLSVPIAAKTLGISEKTVLNVRRKMIIKVEKLLFD